MGNLGVISALVAVALLVVAAMLYTRGNHLAARVVELLKEAEQKSQRLEEAREEMGSRKEDVERLRKELKEAQDNLKQVRKKAFQAGEELKGARAGTGADERLRGELERTKESFEHARELAETRARRIAELEKEQQRAAGERERMKEDAAREVQGELDALRRKAGEAERRAEDRPPTIDPRELQRHKRRADNNHAVYMVTKGKLEVTEDRYQELLARHQRVLDDLAAMKTGRSVEEVRAAAGAAERERPRRRGRGAREAGEVAAEAGVVDVARQEAPATGGEEGPNGTRDEAPAGEPAQVAAAPAAAVTGGGEA